jgi:integrase
MTLQELLDIAIQHQLIKDTRIEPMRTAITHYAAMLGVDPVACLPAVYDLATHQLTALVHTQAPAHWNRRMRSTFSNHPQWLLRLGREQGWLQARDTHLKSWRDHRDGPKEGWVPRHELPPKLIYRLQEMPASLEQEIQSYLQWCQRVVQPGRPHSVKKRATTCHVVSEGLTRMAGFAVHFQHLPAELLTLRDLCDPALVHEFIQWWVEKRRRKLTPGLRNMVVNLEVIARHWLKDLTIADALKDLLKGDLAVADAVRDKQTRWLSLAQIDAVGQTVYPLNPTRLHDFWEARTIQRHLTDSTRYPLPSKSCNLTLYAYWAGVSLILRFLVRRPLRQRNAREMTLQRNLYQDHEGLWRIRFRGQELKVDRRDGGVNRYECLFPQDLVPLLEEYLTVWRPRLARVGEEHVFLNSKGHPFSANRLTGVVAVTSMRFTRVGVTPHIIRDIFATEYLKQYPGDAAGAAKRLGNTIAVVYRHYAHLLDQEADTRVDTFLQGALRTENPRDGTTKAAS